MKAGHVHLRRRPRCGSDCSPFLFLVWAVLRVQAGIGNPQPLHGPAAHQVLVDNGLGIRRCHIPVPDSLGVNNHRWPVFALVQAAGLIDAHGLAEAGVFGKLFQFHGQFALSIGGAGFARRIGRARVLADKYVAFKGWQGGFSWEWVGCSFRQPSVGGRPSRTSRI